MHKLNISSLPSIVAKTYEIPQGHELQLAKNILAMGFVFYSHFVQFDSFEGFSDTQKLEKMKALSSKFCYANLYESQSQPVGGSVLAPCGIELEYVKTRSNENRMLQHHYVKSKQLLDICIEFSHEVINQIILIMNIILQKVNTDEERESLVIKKKVSREQATEEDLVEFQSLFEGLYQKFQAGDKFECLTAEKITRSMGSRSSERALYLFEKLSSEEIWENVKAVIYNLELSSSKRLNILAPEFLLKLAQNETEAKELSGATLGLLTKENSQVGVPDMKEILKKLKPQNKWHVFLQNSTMDLKFYRRHEHSNTLQARAIFETNRFMFVGSTSQYDWKFEFVDAILCNHNQLVKNSMLKMKNSLVVRVNPELKGLREATYEILIKAGHAIYQKKNQSHDISLKVSEITMERELRGNIAPVISLGSLIKTKSLKEPKPCFDVAIGMGYDYVTKNEYKEFFVKTIKGTMGSFVVHDVEGLIALLAQNADQKQDMQLLYIRFEEIWKRYPIETDISLVDIGLVFKMKDIDVAFMLCQFDLKSHEQVTTINAAKMLILRKSDKKSQEFVPASNAFQMRSVFKSAAANESSMQESIMNESIIKKSLVMSTDTIDFRMSKVKLAIHKKEQVSIVKFVEGCLQIMRTGFNSALETFQNGIIN